MRLRTKMIFFFKTLTRLSKSSCFSGVYNENGIVNIKMDDAKYDATHSHYLLVSFFFGKFLFFVHLLCGHSSRGLNGIVFLSGAVPTSCHALPGHHQHAHPFHGLGRAAAPTVHQRPLIAAAAHAEGVAQTGAKSGEI